MSSGNLEVISTALYGSLTLIIRLDGIPYAWIIFFFSAKVNGDFGPVTPLVAMYTFLAPNFFTKFQARL